ncbi:MAG: hypothetical protein KAX15_08165 [Candidatus Omnitrophica bacterium]|nr:hypothetical protein [Candidatus Omnitrophota bacterium]
MRTLFQTKNVDHIVDAFTEEYPKGRNPRISYYINNFKGNKQKLREELIAVKIAYLIAHPQFDIKGDEESLKNLLITFKKITNP